MSLVRTIPCDAKDGGARIALYLAVEAGIAQFVRSYISDAAQGASVLAMPKGSRFPLQHHAISKLYLRPLELGRTASPEMVQVLLESGADPNEEFLDQWGERTTPWVSWLKQCGWQKTNSTIHHADTMILLVKAGADTSAPVIENAVGTGLRNLIRKRLLLFASSSSKDRTLVRRKGRELLQLLNTTEPGAGEDSDRELLVDIATKASKRNQRTKRAPEDDFNLAEGAKRQCRPWPAVKRGTKSIFVPGEDPQSI
ncbi:hypothetical protein B0T14DRAFT_253682 [Immersiella caudata]|uniref:Ankyrin n=1 Tax=Immersiella caudata TaxID=314043 RepID=A0AA39WK42_9PEZI|nr:hypothetical protein B0T14DRAFT_253682 [Immersiella caudata]